MSELHSDLPVERMTEFKYFGTDAPGMNVNRRIKTPAVHSTIRKALTYIVPTICIGFDLPLVISSLYFCKALIGIINHYSEED